MNSQAFHTRFDIEAHNITEACREPLLEGPGTCTREQLIGQIMMNELFPHPCDSEAQSDWPAGLTSEQKVTLLKVADQLGPNFCQALYHAAVFMTKVA